MPLWEAANAYEYRPRGFYETEYPNLPYPEVISGTENGDGTLTLLVNAVYPSAETSRAFTHELTIRPDAQGGFQYLSNRVLPSGQDYERNGPNWKQMYLWLLNVLPPLSQTQLPRRIAMIPVLQRNSVKLPSPFWGRPVLSAWRMIFP